MAVAAEDGLLDLVRGLWKVAPGHPLGELLPLDREGLGDQLGRLQAFLAAAPRRREGTVEPGAIVRGEVVHLGAGAVIEAGAVVHESCRLWLGSRSRVRAGAVLREAVVIGDDCLVGCHCEVARSVFLGPGTIAGHQVVVLDSILGAGALLSGAVATANTKLDGSRVALRRGGAALDSGRTHLGALVGDGARLGAGIVLCPGTVVLPGLDLPPGAVLLGVIDGERRRRLYAEFFARWGDRA